MQIKETVEESVGRQIQRIRRERGYTQQVFSEMVGISTNYLSDVERGKSSGRRFFQANDYYQRYAGTLLQ